ncbi:MAG TPA: YciI family protein, partial [Acidobacteriota bacterium]
EDERNAWMQECVAYDAVLKKNGHFIGGEALEPVRNCKTLKTRNGKVSITDGPFAETKEQLGGLMILEAKDLNESVQLISKHPGLRKGTFEIRGIENILPGDLPRISDPK